MVEEEHIPLQTFGHQPNERQPNRKPKSTRQRLARWFVIPDELPRQLNRSQSTFHLLAIQLKFDFTQVEWITIGKTIGQGLFLKLTSSGLVRGGPIGVLIAYTLTSSIVFFILQSTGEIVTFRPHTDGVVTSAEEFVDAALAFSMAFNVVYNWALIVPVQLVAAVLLASTFLPESWEPAQINSAKTGFAMIFLLAAVGLNIVKVNTFTRIQKYLTVTKIWLAIALIIMNFVICLTPVPVSIATPYLAGMPSEDVAAHCAAVFGLDDIAFNAVRTASSADQQTYILHGLIPDRRIRLGFSYWQCEAFVQYRSIGGPAGRFFGTWDVLMQAAFSFQGMEVGTLIPGEIKNPHSVVLPVTKTVWREITALYIGGVFSAGLVVPANAQLSQHIKRGSAQALVSFSPFIIALQTAQVAVLPSILTACFIESAWSAAVSGMFVTSRLLFLLAERGHAPRILMTSYLRPGVFIPWVGVLISGLIALLSLGSSTDFYSWLADMTTCAAIVHWVASLVTYLRWFRGTLKAERADAIQTERAVNDALESARNEARLNHLRPPSEREESAIIERHSDSPFKTEVLARIYRHRHRLQPWGALYSLVLCILILLFNGWVVFTVPGAWRITEEPGLPLNDIDSAISGSVHGKFITSYLPLPMFLLTFFGYKLITQSPKAPLSSIRWPGTFEHPTGSSPDDDDHWTSTAQRYLRSLTGFPTDFKFRRRNS